MFFYSMVAIDMHEPLKELKWWAVIFFSLTPLNNGDTIVRGIGNSEGVQNTDWTDFSDSFAVFPRWFITMFLAIVYFRWFRKTRFLISVYAFYENMHYTEKN